MMDVMVEYPLRWITQQLAVGYSPKSYEDLDFIKEQGIGVIVNLCAECYDLNEIEKNAGFIVYHLPIPDENSPDLEDVKKALAWIDDIINQGQKVLVHCRFGIGRTGTFVIAYLLKNGFSLDDALEKMERTPSFPQSQNQWRFLKEFGESLGIENVTEVSNEKGKHTALDTFFKRWEAMRDWLIE
jgi:protein-tyrosine phosphatase